MEASEDCAKHGRPYAYLINPITSAKILFCEMCSNEQEAAAGTAKQQRQAQQQQAAIDSALNNAMLAPRFKSKTLENYAAVEQKQQAAVEAARWFLSQIEAKQAASLILLGAPGTGKNHLAAGIINAFVQQPGRTALFTEASKFIRSIKESWRKEGNTESEVLRLYREPDLLVIDELGVQFGSETEKMYLTELINDRYNYLKSTVLIGNLTLSELIAMIGQRAVDRMRENGKTVIFDWESYRSRR